MTLGVALGYYHDPLWLLVPGFLGVTLLLSGFTGFCPVYFILDRTCSSEASVGDEVHGGFMMGLSVQ